MARRQLPGWNCQLPRFVRSIDDFEGRQSAAEISQERTIRCSGIDEGLSFFTRDLVEHLPLARVQILFDLITDLFGFLQSFIVASFWPSCRPLICCRTP
jgi:hypothetical protein